MNTLNKRSTNRNGNAANAPDWIAKAVKQIGRKEKLERVGAAWNREEDGGICLRLHGTQIVTEDIYLYPNEPSDDQ